MNASPRLRDPLVSLPTPPNPAPAFDGRPSLLARCAHLARWYERTSHPDLVLCAAVVLLYGWTLPWGFVLDDYRHIRLCREYHEGARDTLGLYRFLSGDEENRRLRLEGRYPWWLGDDVRYQHMRPLAERLLYWEYVLFSGHPLGYRLTSLGLYTAGALIVLRLFRQIGGDERLARWAALAFTVALGRAVPVVFISMQCDLLSLVLVALAALSGGRFVMSGGAWRAAAATAIFTLALGAKESALPAAIWPLCVYLVARERPGAGRRAAVLTAVLAIPAIAMLALYIRGGYGSNTVLILDPIRAPGEYLAALPGRALLMLCTFVEPFNPFLCYLRPRGRIWLWVIALYGGAVLAAVGWLLWRRHRRQRGVASMALWIAPFLPLLACTIPDDRNMMLPSIGFAFLAAAWMTWPLAEGSHRLRRLPLFLFILGQPPGVWIVSGAVRSIEKDSQRLLEVAIAAFERPLRENDRIFFINDARDWDLLFIQDALEWATRRGGAGQGARVSFLSDLQSARVTRLDERTLRIEGIGQPLFEGFLGDMAASRTRPKREGDAFDAGEFTARIARVEDGRVRAAELRFAEPLESERYRFFGCRLSDPPRRTAVPAVGESMDVTW